MIRRIVEIEHEVAGAAQEAQYGSRAMHGGWIVQNARPVGTIQRLVAGNEPRHQASLGQIGFLHAGDQRFDVLRAVNDGAQPGRRVVRVFDRVAIHRAVE